MEKLLLLIVKLKKKGFFHLIVSNYSIQFVVFGSHLLVAKIMTPSTVGILKTIETFCNMAIVLGGGGMVFAILKVVPQNKNKNLRSQSIRYALKYVVFFSLAIFVFFNLMGYLNLLSRQKELVYWFHMYSIIIIPSVITILFVRYYQAIDEFKRISAIVLVLRLISAAFVLSLTYYFFIEGYVISMVVTTSLSTLVLLYDLRNEIIGNSFSAEFNDLKKSIIGLSKTAFLAQIIDQLKLHSGFLIASYVILDEVEFGHYSFALILIQGLNIVSTSVQQFIIPKMSEAANDYSLFFKKHKQFENKYILISIFIFFAAQLLLPLIIEFLFENKYDDSIILLRIMLIGWFVQAFYNIKGVIFLSLGKMKYISYSSLSIFLISSPLIYILNIKYGVLGAAYAYLLQNIISFLMIRFYARKVFKSLN